MQDVAGSMQSAMLPAIAILFYLEPYCVCQPLSEKTDSERCSPQYGKGNENDHCQIFTFHGNFPPLAYFLF
jgi:hypothetical protein